MLLPLFQLQDFVFTLVVLGSLAAVVLGGLRSIPIAFAGGLLLGVVQNLVAGYATFAQSILGFNTSVPFVVLLVAVVLTGLAVSRLAVAAIQRLPVLASLRSE